MINSLDCTHPLKRFYNGKKTVNGKPDGIITSFKVDHLELYNGKWTKSYNSFVPRGALHPYVFDKYEVIPCGKCMACRLKKARNWANRLMLEVPYHIQSWFITLTLDNDHVLYGDVVPDDDGVMTRYTTVNKDELRNFMKRLRSAYHRKWPNAPPLKSFGCGEYGSKRFRSHYHIIVFGLYLDDAIPDDKELSKSDQLMYTSKFVESCWTREDRGRRKSGSDKDLIGRVRLSPVNWNTCSYIARYTMKKQYGPASVLYDEMGIEPPFLLMSKGLSKEFYNDNKDQIYKFDEVNVSTDHGGLHFKPPAIYDKWYDIDYPGAIDDIKAARKYKAELKLHNLIDHLGIPFEQYCQEQEYLIERRSNSLIRDLD